MKSLALLLSALAAIGACGGDDDDDVVIIEPGDLPLPDAGTPPSTTAREWTANIVGVDVYNKITGTATVRQVDAEGAFNASITLRNDKHGAVRPWHVHFGTCASGGGIVGPDASYTRLTIADDGTASASVRITTLLDPAAAYHVNVHLSDAMFGVIVACGDLVLR